MSEISVELRLQLNKLREDIKSAAAMMKAGLAVNLGTTAQAGDKAAASMDKLENKIRKTTNALKAQKDAALAAWRAAVPAPNITDNSGSTSSGRKGYVSSPANYATMMPRVPIWIARMRAAVPPQYPAAPSGGRNPSDFIKNIGFSALPIANPTSMLANLASYRQSFKAFNTPSGGAIMGKAGLSGVGGAAAAAGVVTAAAAGVGIALLALRKTVTEVMQSFARAKQLYSRALTSGGMSLGFNAERGTLSRTMGISEDEVHKFGDAVDRLSGQLRWASKAQAASAPILTATAWQFGVLKENLHALWDTIAAQLAPTLIVVTAGLAGFVEVLGKLAKVLEGAALNALLGPIMAKALLLFKEKGIASLAAPAPAASPNRLPASAWERMGLVLGNVGSSNSARETARNTKRTADILERIYNMPRSGSEHMNPSLHNSP